MATPNIETIIRDHVTLTVDEVLSRVVDRR